MFWERYIRVCGVLLLAGALIGGSLFLLFALVVPADPGEGGVAVVVLLTLWGGLIGTGIALAASAGFAIFLSLWVRKAHRSVGSRAWIGAAGAAVGAALVWIVAGIAWGLSNPYLWGNFWIAGILATFCATLAAVVAGPSVVRAARIADRSALAA